VVEIYGLFTGTLGAAAGQLVHIRTIMSWLLQLTSNFPVRP
jgi:hypothetical protein